MPSLRSAIIAIILLGSAPSFADSKVTPELKKDIAAALTVRYAGVASDGDVVKVRVQDGMKAPSWSELRERARKVHALVVAKGVGKIVVVDYVEAGAMAIAEALPGTSAVNVRVGAGRIFQDDRAVFSLSVTGGIAFVDSSQDDLPGRVKSATCGGKVKNLGTTERAIAVRCVVKRYTMQHRGTTVDMKGGLSQSQVIVDETVQVGKVKPGAEATFSRALTAKEWPMITGADGEVAVVADGAPAAHLDAATLAIATEWLAVVDKLRADGLAVETRSPYDLVSKLGGGLPERKLELFGDDLEKRDPADLGKAVARAWTALKAFHGKTGHPFPQAVKVRGRAMNKATVTDGKLGPWGQDLY